MTTPEDIRSEVEQILTAQRQRLAESGRLVDGFAAKVLGMLDDLEPAPTPEPVPEPTPEPEPEPIPTPDEPAEGGNPVDPPPVWGHDFTNEPTQRGPWTFRDGQWGNDREAIVGKEARSTGRNGHLLAGRVDAANETPIIVVANRNDNATEVGRADTPFFHSPPNDHWGFHDHAEGLTRLNTILQRRARTANTIRHKSVSRWQGQETNYGIGVHWPAFINPSTNKPFTSAQNHGLNTGDHLGYLGLWRDVDWTVPITPWPAGLTYATTWCRWQNANGKHRLRPDSPDWWNGKDIFLPGLHDGGNGHQCSPHMSFVRTATHKFQVPHVHWFLATTAPTTGKPYKMSGEVQGPYIGPHLELALCMEQDLSDHIADLVRNKRALGRARYFAN